MFLRSVFSTAGLARLSARRPWVVLGTWLVVLILAMFAATGIGDALTTENKFTNSPDSVRADDLITERLRDGQEKPASETVVIRSDTLTIDDAAFRATVEATTADLRALSGIVVQAGNYYEASATGDPGAARMVSADKRSTIIPITMAGTRSEMIDHVEEYHDAVHANARDGFELLPVGDVSIDHLSFTTSEEDLAKGEAFGMVAALIILIVVFGALVAAGLPIGLGLIAIVVAVGITAILGQVMDLSFFIINMISMIGLAVGIDYALFVVERYREERTAGHDKLAAIEIAGGTASKAVLFSGATVVLALSGMLLMPATTFQSLGAGAIIVVIVAVLAMLTLVPAALSLLGDRINWPSRRRRAVSRKPSAVSNDGARDSALGTQHSGGVWNRITHAVMARPLVCAVIAILLLVACTVPYFDLEKGRASVETFPDGEAKSGFIALKQDFYAGLISPVEIAIDGQTADPQITAATANLTAAMEADGAFGPATATHDADGNLTVLSVPLKADANDASSYEAVDRLRDTLIPAAFADAPAEVYVGGETALSLDFNDTIDTWTPRVFGFVLGLSFLLLLVAFRSIVVPITAIAMNLLSVGAAYGLLVLVFQKGYGANFFGFTQTPTIEAFLPIFLFCVLFGLSMDYHVFLLSRIREHYDRTGRNAESVAAGLQSTAKIITGAALIMVAVFCGFASGRLVTMQQIGFGLAVAVLLDATVVRSILVPSLMKLLGDKNWYLPRWLHWMPNLSIEGAPAKEPVLAPVAATAPQATAAD